MVLVYTIDNCPFCVRAKALLNARGIPFEEKKVDRNDAEAVQALVQRSKMRTFPQIFTGEKLVGGYTELEKLDLNGPLAEALINLARGARHL